MPAPFDQNTADALLTKGMITPEQHAKAMDMLNYKQPGSYIPSIVPEAWADEPKKEFGIPGAAEMNKSVGQSPTISTDTLYIDPSIAAGGRVAPLSPSALSEGVGAESKPVEAPKVTFAQTGPTPAPSESPTIKGITEGYKMMQEGLRDEAAANQKAALAQASEMDRHMRAVEAKAAFDQSREFERQAEISKQEQDYQRISDDIINNSKIDPNRMWQNMDTGNRIAAGLAIALGSIGGVMTGQGGNAAMSVIDKAIDRDIDAQKSALENKRTALSAQGNMLSMMRQRFGDERQAEAAARAASYDLAAMRLRQIATKYQGQEIAAKAKFMEGKIMAQRDAELAPFYQAAQTQAAIKGLSGGGDVSPAQLQALPKDVRERFVQGPGFKGLAATEAEGKALRDGAAGVDSATKGIDELIKIGQDKGTQILPSEASKRAETISSVIKGVMREQILGPGTVNDKERAILDRLVGNPTAIFQMDSRTKVGLETLKQQLMSTLHSKAKAAGLNVASADKVGFKEIKE